MKIAISVLLLAIGLPTAAIANDNARTLAASNALLNSDNLDLAKHTACQPLRGEQVQVLETKSNIGGMVGANAARVVVIEGQCKGTEGWVGLTQLEKGAARR